MDKTKQNTPIGPSYPQLVDDLRHQLTFAAGEMDWDYFIATARRAHDAYMPVLFVLVSEPEPEERPTLWGLRERILQMFPKVTIRINAQGRRLRFYRCTVYISAGKVPKIAVKYKSPLGISIPEKARYFAFEDEAKAANYIASIHNWRTEK